MIASSAFRRRVSSIARARREPPDVLADQREQPLVAFRVDDVLRVRLHDEDPDRAALGLERDPEPGRFRRVGADDLDLARRGELPHALVREQLRRAGAEHVRGRAAGVACAEGVPHVGVRHIHLDLVDVVGPADQLALLVIEGDEEVVRVHQLADDRVHLPVELLHVLRRARQLGDAVQPGLNLLGVPTIGLGGLELGKPVARGVQLRTELGVATHGSNPTGPVGSPRRPVSRAACTSSSQAPR